MTVDLKKCPFCGCKELSIAMSGVEVEPLRQVFCHDCGATGPSDGEQELSAEALWNGRKKKDRERVREIMQG